MTPDRPAPFMSRAPQLSRVPWGPLAEFVHRELHPQRPAYGDEDKRFLALAIAGEVGELCNLVKKDWQEEGGIAKPQDGSRPEKIRLELADVRIYLEMLAFAYDVDLDRACQDKLAICLDRWPEIKERLATLRGNAAPAPGHGSEKRSVDHRALLKKYVSHILDVEGVHHIDFTSGQSIPPELKLTMDDVAALKQIARELGCEDEARETVTPQARQENRCPQCRTGVAVGTACPRCGI